MSGRVSVLVPTFNRGRYIDECLDSLINQTTPPYEIIVIDDGSDDDTADRVRRHGDRLTYIRKENGGKASALNLALPRVGGDFVWMFDDDDVALPDAIARHLAALEAEPKSGFTYSGHFWGTDGPNQAISIVREYALPNVPRDAFLLSVLRDCYFTLQGVVVRKRCLDAVGRFDEGLLRSQDYQMLIRLARQFPAARLDGPTFVFRRHEGQRGPRQIRHLAMDKLSIWSAYDQQIGRFIREQLSLGEYLTPPGPGTPGKAADLGAALLNRAGVMATKGLMQELLEDFESVVTISRSDAELNTVASAQKDMLVRTVNHPYFQRIVTPDVDAFISSLSRIATGPVGARILRAFSLGYLRYAKSFEGGLRDRLHRLQIAARLGIASIRC